jgi:uncharacterized protein
LAGRPTAPGRTSAASPTLEISSTGWASREAFEIGRIVPASPYSLATLLLELAEALGNEAIYAAADGPEAAVPGFWERLWTRAEEAAGALGRSVVLLDEVQHLPDWDVRLKGEWDRLRRRRARIHVVATGSSALHLGRGSRESLAGRFERLTLTHWSASALVEAFGLSPDDATDAVVRMGAYPGAIGLRSVPARGARDLTGIDDRRGR